MAIHARYNRATVHSKKYHYTISQENDIQRKFKFKSREAFFQAKAKYKALFLNRWLWISIGKALAVLYALGCALTIGAAAVAFLCGLTGVMWPGIIAGAIMFISGFVFNIKISWKSTPQVLLDFFARGGWFKGLFEYIDRAGKKINLSKTRRRWFYFGILGAVASAATWAAIGWGEIVGALGMLLSVSASALPPGLLIVTGIVVAGLFFATLSMLLKEMSHMLGKGDIVKRLSTFWGKVKYVFSGQYFKDLWAKSQNEYPKKTIRAFTKQLLKDTRSIAVSVVVVGLTLAGLVMLMKTGTESLAEILVNRVNFSAIAANIVAGINCFLFAFCGELPFSLGTSTFASASINKWLNHEKSSTDKSPKKENGGFKAKLKTLANITWRPIHLFNALGMGLIAMKTFMGNLASNCSSALASGPATTTPPDVGMMTFSLLTGFFNSYTAGFHGDDDAEGENEYRMLRKPQDCRLSRGLFAERYVHSQAQSLPSNAQSDELTPLLMRGNQ